MRRDDGTATVWNPGANGLVRRLVYGSDHLVAAGDFTRIGDSAVAYFAVFSVRPFIPSGGLRMGGDGIPEVTVWEGDVCVPSIVLQVADAAAGSPWTDLGSRVANGRPKSLSDPFAVGRPSRFYRAVAR